MIKMLLHHELVVATAFRPCTEGETLLNNTNKPFSVIKSPDNYWLADPVLFTCEGRSFLFMEAFNKPEYVGEIAVTELCGDSAAIPHIILREPFHLSFPTVFSWNDRVFMLPECSEDKSIRLYEAVRFPDEWRCVKRFDMGARYVDTIILNKTMGDVTILTCEVSPDVQYACRYQKFTILKSGEDYDIIPDESFNATQSFSYLSRNAGSLIMENGVQLLPAQESTEFSYGVNLNFYPFNETEAELTQNSIKKIMPSDIRVEGMKEIQGIHSYCVNAAYEVVDALYLEWSPFKYYRRFRRRRKMQQMGLNA